MKLTTAEKNHLHRLLGWIACEIGQDPDEMIATLKKIAPAVGDNFDDDAKRRIVEGLEKSAAVPKYVRAAVKSLRRAINTPGDVVDADAFERRVVIKGKSNRAALRVS